MRNLLLVKTSENPEEAIDVSSENLKLLREESEMVDVETLMRYIRIFSDLSSQIRYSTQKRVLVEIALINFIVNENPLHYAAVAFVEGILSLGAEEDCLWLLFHSFKILACYNQRVVHHIFQCLICKICGVRQHKYIRHRV